MKKTKIKILAMAMALVMVAVSSSLLTMAYLTAETEKVTNTFTNSAGVVIDLDEAKTNKYGAKEGTARVRANNYTLIPNHTYAKDPTIHVASTSEDCWIFVKVTNNLFAIEAAGTTTIAAQMKTKGWSAVEGATGVYAYKEIATAGKDYVVFEEFVIDAAKTNTELSAYDGKTIEIIGYAVQADGFLTAKAAWDAAGFKA